ncbi:MAG: hypothetical protein ISN26_06750 [Betaproteobacteria bacterium AqS2]|uniref:Uncharacterized protein n=1 Tax=Candidatus Amphirhobacter heronislandensis TaxID=1732024 RepID=A0A930UHA6_9GAMM|nr:hypothetical protein [Betaproteobacteria bacterium AqS2]
MRALRGGGRAAAALLLASLPAAAQQTEWSPEPLGGEAADVVLLLEHEQLRAYAPRGPVIRRERLGPLVLEIRAGAADAAPASLAVRMRNRLVAAAQGRRIGGDIIHNGVLIEAWDGRDRCEYVQWRLRFVGERLALDEAKRLRQRGCDG